MSMQDGVFLLNEQARVHVESIPGGCQVLVVDDLYADPDAVRASALAGSFDSSLAYYPGVHSSIRSEQLHALYTRLAKLISLTSGAHCNVEDFRSDFSLVTTPAKDMLAKQKHPHIDGSVLGGVVYLSPNLTIGTSFFRHVPLGLSMLCTPEETERYNVWLDQEGEREQPVTYAVEDGVSWQQLHTISGRYNRAVFYPGNAFHSIAMRDVGDALTLETARLTQRIFVHSLSAAQKQSPA